MMPRPVHSRLLLRWAQRTVLAVSMLLVLLAALGWWRSHRVGDQWMHDRHRIDAAGVFTRTIGFAHGGGDFVFFTISGHFRNPNVLRTWIHLTFTPTPVRMLMSGYVHGIGGYGWSTWTETSGLQAPPNTVSAIVFPYWLAVLVGSLAPAWWLWGGKRRRRAHRLAAGWCANCGYDLRASPERCPECGTTSPALDHAQ